MANICKTDRHIIRQLDHISVIIGNKMLQNPQSIVHLIERLHFGISGPPCFAVLPLSFHFLNMGTILQHNITEITGSICRHNRTRKAAGIDIRKHSGMIDMGMCKQYIINL